MTGHNGSLARTGPPCHSRPASARPAEGVLSTANGPDRRRNRSRAQASFLRTRREVTRRVAGMRRQGVLAWPAPHSPGLRRTGPASLAGTGTRSPVREPPGFTGWIRAPGRILCPGVHQNHPGAPIHPGIRGRAVPGPARAPPAARGSPVRRLPGGRTARTGGLLICRLLSSWHCDRRDPGATSPDAHPDGAAAPAGHIGLNRHNQGRGSPGAPLTPAAAGYQTTSAPCDMPESHLISE